MVLFWIIYLLGVVATLLFLYRSLEHGSKVTILDIVLALTMSAFSWCAFVIVIVLFFGDRVAFTKK